MRGSVGKVQPFLQGTMSVCIGVILFVMVMQQANNATVPLNPIRPTIIVFFMFVGFVNF
jgi:hypothetical protein